ncbi:Retrovirus polyprotein [Penicillium robsamsonii]|uniref:Retrovirus polyprotein n=1 Tax=Penicillium robsamsonii TaxID=1792511 RepID=UPI0025497F96|nr:Retrovirus polyprotein [Penicillium robsamsonii]KAJ5824413.1 Retrovirus polyprotein [Penicillium robsamsonii]
MLLADLGKYDLILGRKWFAEHNVLLDYRHVERRDSAFEIEYRHRRVEEQRKMARNINDETRLVTTKKKEALVLININTIGRVRFDRL